MKVQKEKFQTLIFEIEGIINSLRNMEKRFRRELKTVHPNHLKSAKNLIHYRKLRSYDMRSLQKILGNLGLSRFAHAEQHVLFNFYNVKFILEKVLGSNKQQSGKSGLSIKTSRKLLSRNAEALLGPNFGSCRVRMMVTIPVTGAYNRELIDELVSKGMSMARINCSHDSPEVWKMMIDNIRAAEVKYNRKVKISMDLGGPKIRTGQIRPGPRVTRINPKRNSFGNVIIPGKAFLIPKSYSENRFEIPVDPNWYNQLVVNDRLKLVDTRGKKRYLQVIDFEEERIGVGARDRVFISTGTEIKNESNGKVTKVGDLPTCEEKITLAIGDDLIIDKNSCEGELAKYNDLGEMVGPAHISCTLPEIINQLTTNDIVKFDDGKITGIVTEIDQENVSLRIIGTKGKSTALRSDKGMNFPGKDLKISGLTEKDREDLKFIVKYADAVNYSFINTPADIQELFDVLDALEARDKIGVILKIETQSAYNSLFRILLKGMETYPLGVMIARGDLAIETGWNKMGRIQEEILAVCSAAHVPVIWATQVLESLAKQGVPSRSEITDATKSIKAECVMLNKGPYITKAMELLTEILTDAEDYHEKNSRMLPELVRV